MNETELKDYILKLNQEYKNIQESLDKLKLDLEYVLQLMNIETYYRDTDDILRENKNVVYSIDNSNFYLDYFNINGRDCLVFKPYKVIKYESSN